MPDDRNYYLETLARMEHPPVTPASNRLIVALDTEASLRHIDALSQAGVDFFKLNATSLMDPSLFDIVHLLGKLNADFFLDLKIYDTRDTVYNVARRAFDLGARFLTVHATPSMLEAAMRAKPAGDDYAKVIAIDKLTDAPTGQPRDYTLPCFECDGVVCPSSMISSIRETFQKSAPIIVCPGIRRGTPNDRPNSILGGYESPDNHSFPATPTEAIRAGADYIVVGRPIINSTGPDAAARAIIAEIEEAPR